MQTNHSGMAWEHLLLKPLVTLVLVLLYSYSCHWGNLSLETVILRIFFFGLWHAVISQLQPQAPNGW